MNITINPLSLKSVDSAISRIDAFTKKLKKLDTELPRVLAEYGAEGAQVRFDTAIYDVLLNGAGTIADIRVTAEPIPDGFAVVANGREVCFVEFGAGVHFNGAESYKGTRPAEVKGIGQFGQGKGKQNVWGYYNGFSGNLSLTYGTPASNAMYYTTRDMKRRLSATARRILRGD